MAWFAGINSRQFPGKILRPLLAIAFIRLTFWTIGYFPLTYKLLWRVSKSRIKANQTLPDKMFSSEKGLDSRDKYNNNNNVVLMRIETLLAFVQGLIKGIPQHRND